MPDESDLKWNGGASSKCSKLKFIDVTFAPVIFVHLKILIVLISLISAHPLGFASLNVRVSDNVIEVLLDCYY